MALAYHKPEKIDEVLQQAQLEVGVAARANVLDLETEPWEVL